MTRIQTAEERAAHESVMREMFPSASSDRPTIPLGRRSPAGTSTSTEPKAAPVAPNTKGKPPIIEVRAGELHVIATTGERALIDANAPIYVRGGLVRPIVDDLPAAHGRRANVARLTDVTQDGLLDYLSRSASWVRFNVRKDELVRTDPPRSVAATILSRDGEWGFSRLAGVITTQTLRPDGSILATPGYDPVTQLLLLDPPKMPTLPAVPTRADALQALETLDGLLDEFPFVDAASRSVALSGLITPVVRGAMSVTPLHAFSAPVPGSGKSYTVDLAAAISTGQRAPVIAAGQTDEETEKRLGAALLSGQPIVTIDNVNGRLGGDALCQLIERPVVSVRPLGVSKLVRIESRATCFATGNNIQLVGDMTRRVVLCSLDPNMERPELRRFHHNPFEAVLADRGRYVAAALTISSAYIGAGCPGQLPALASFDDWSRVVRSALVWLGRADPAETMEAARAEDPVISSLRTLYAAWYAAAGSTSRSAGAMKDLAEELNPFGNRCQPELYRALCDVAEDRRGTIDPRKLGSFLGNHKGRIIDGLKLQYVDDKHNKQKLWSVTHV